MRILGLTSTTLGVLTLYFFAVGQYLDQDAYTSAEHALVTGLRTAGGGFGIATISLGLGYLNLRDEATIRKRKAAEDDTAGGEEAR